MVYAISVLEGRVVTQTTQILCAHCRIPLKGAGELDPNTILICEGCGQSDTFEAILAEVKEYVTEMAAQKIGDMFAGIGNQSKYLKVTKTYSGSGKQWRFIADVDL